LMVAKEAPNLTPSQVTQKASDYFNAMFTRPDATNKQLSVVYNANSNVTLTGSATLNTMMARVIGKSQMNIGTSTTVKWGNDRLRVALVLDNTGSMNDNGKISALKSATKNLLTTLQAAATIPDDVYVSIIPFSKDVNIGKSNHAASYLDWSAWDSAKTVTVNSNQFCFNGWTWNGWNLNYVGNCPSTTTAANHNTWNGCVMDRGTATPPG